MNKLISIVLFGIIILLTGNTHAIELKTKKAIYQHCQTNYDKFKKELIIYAPWTNTQNEAPVIWLGSPIMFDRFNFSLRCIRLEERETYQVVVLLWKDDWCFCKSAIHENSTELKFINIDTRVDGKGIQEHFALNIPLTYLYRDGFSIKIYSRRCNNIIIKFPSYYIKGFLLKVNE